MSPDPLRPLQDTIVRLLKTRPFYGQFLLQFRRVCCHDRKAVSVTLADAIPTLFVNPQQFELFSAPEQEALLEHLIKHVLHLHPARRKERHHRAWDLACDLAINPSIANLPPQAIHPERLKLRPGLAAEEYYQQLLLLPELGSLTADGHGEELSRSAEKIQEGAGQPDGQLKTLDSHQHWQEADRTPLSLAHQVVRQMVRTARQRTQEEPVGELAQLLAAYLQPAAIPWQQVLRQFVGNAGRTGQRTTWSRPHRRFNQSTPGIRKEHLLNLLVAVDVSDSTDSQTLRETFAAELLHIARGRHSRLTVLYSGSRIQRIERFNGAPQVAEVYRGGGFTDFRPVFDYAAQMQPRPAAVIYLTDGDGPAPEYSDIPTLWVLSAQGKKPASWGLELRLCEQKGQPQ